MIPALFHLCRNWLWPCTIMRMVPVLLVISLVFVYGCGGCNDDDDEYDFRVEYVYGAQGTEPGQFNTPLGIQIRRVHTADHSRLFVADYGNRRVQALAALPDPSSQPDSASLSLTAPFDYPRWIFTGYTQYPYVLYQPEY